jgi:hypothetical protein
MSTRDLQLIELYRAHRNMQALALASRHSPLLRFDAREPFLPLAAGYTIFTQDGPSPSMKRLIQLCPPGKPAAAQAIEYAIWWDWDIHHLYELEHVWIYLDSAEQTVRVEASWHGEYREIPLALENDHAVLLSEPGKHAFAPSPDWFRERSAQVRRVETLAVAAHAHVLINSMFAGRIRQRRSDQALVRSFLSKRAFTPAWDFSQKFTFRADWLVPWPILEAWIPGRVNRWLDRLEESITPTDYRPLRLVSGGASLENLRAAAEAGADSLFLDLHLSGDTLRLDGTSDSADIDSVFQFCEAEPIYAFCQPGSLPALERLAKFIQDHDLQDSLPVTCADPGWLKRLRELVPQAVTAIQIPDPAADPLQAATQCGAQYVHPRWEAHPGAMQALTPEWIERVHRSGLGIISWPVAAAPQRDDLQLRGVDIVWEPFPAAGPV